MESGPYFRPDETVDVAVFRVQGYDPRLPWVPLGSHLDDWLGESDFVLAEIGRASWRGRGEMSVGAGSLKKKYTVWPAFLCVSCYSALLFYGYGNRWMAP